MALEMKKSPKNVGKWLSYCNFSFAQWDFYFLKKIPLYKNHWFFILKFEFQYKNLMVLPEPEDQGDKDYVKKL